jgi:hypothetical protein
MISVQNTQRKASAIVEFFNVKPGGTETKPLWFKRLKLIRNLISLLPMASWRSFKNLARSRLHL